MEKVLKQDEIDALFQAARTTSPEAKPEVRALRRYEELVARGQTVTLEQTLREVLARDHQDVTRAVAPLRRATDALEIDCSEYTIDETVALIVSKVRALGK